MKHFIYSLGIVLLTNISLYAQTITQGEYFINADAGFGNNIHFPVTIAADSSFTFHINANVPAGKHRLFFRLKYNTGHWGITQYSDIEIMHEDGNRHLEKGEYFFNNDPGFGNGIAIPVTANQSEINDQITANTTGLLPGRHKLFVRYKDNNQAWGQTTTIPFERLTSNDVSVIMKGEYFFNSDPGFGLGNLIQVNPVGSVILQDFNASIAGLVPGNHWLYVRLKDNNEKLSTTLRWKIQVKKSTAVGDIIIVEYFFEDDNGVGSCESITLSNPATDGSFSFNIPSQHIPTSADTLFLRVKENGEDNWSLTQWIAQNIVLPTKLLHFDAVAIGDKVNLTWSTAHEGNLNHFNVQRSYNGLNYTDIGKIVAHRRSANTYNYTDVLNTESTQIFYRLQLKDHDGKSSFSQVKLINISKHTTLTISPNPALDRIQLSIAAETDLSQAFVVIHDKAGRVIQKINISNRNIIIPVTQLSAGVYFITLHTISGLYTQKFIKQ